MQQQSLLERWQQMRFGRKLSIIFLGLVLFFGLVIASLPDRETREARERFSARVIPATQQQLAAIASGLQHGMTLTGIGYAVKSNSHNNAYYVAAAFSGPGVSNEIGVWFITGAQIAETRMILSATRKAAAFSEWPAGWEKRVRAGIADEDCRELLRYAEKHP